MRRIIPAGMCVILAMVVFCESDSSYMSAVINGDSWKSNGQVELTARLKKGMDLGGFASVSYLQIRAFPRKPKRVEEIALYVSYIDERPHPRIFDLDPELRYPGISPSFASITFKDSPAPLKTSYGGGGKIRIHEITDEYVTGEFSFVVFDDRGNPITVSDGSFKVPIVE